MTAPLTYARLLEILKDGWPSGLPGNVGEVGNAYLYVSALPFCELRDDVLKRKEPNAVVGKENHEILVRSPYGYVIVALHKALRGENYLLSPARIGDGSVSQMAEA